MRRGITLEIVSATFTAKTKKYSFGMWLTIVH
jgi:hypothetical protein